MDKEIIEKVHDLICKHGFKTKSDARIALANEGQIFFDICDLLELRAKPHIKSNAEFQLYESNTPNLFSGERW